MITPDQTTSTLHPIGFRASEQKRNDVPSTGGVVGELLSVPPRRLHRAWHQIALHQRFNANASVVTLSHTAQLSYTGSQICDRASVDDRA